MNMRLTEVTSPLHVRQFLNLPKKIYKDDPNWIQPLDKDVEKVFDKKQNKFFRHGTCTRWLLLSEQQEVIGRIAAFINKKYKQEQPTGGIGFFECIEDEQAAHFMFDHCREWLHSRGMEAMDGPINFGERDNWWGLVVEGYFEPLYCMNYNPPYYKRFFESYGFRVYFYQECFGMKVTYQFQDKFYKRHEELLRNPDLQARHLVKKDWEKFARDFASVYNKAWAAHGQGKSLEEKQAISLFKSMRPVMDERINWFIYEKEVPVACWINLPDLNQYFKHLHGKFGLLQKLQFLWLKKTKPNPKFVGIVFGVIPEWQGKGMDAYMILEGAKYLIAHSSYTDYEMQWIGDFNPKMTNIARNLGATVTRKLATYRYLFDREKEFKRHPLL